MKTVLMPMDVPDGPHCWNRQNGQICPQFDIEGGTPACSLGFYPLKNAPNGNVAKADECSKLKEA